jgi:hypothetical protein
LNPGFTVNVAQNRIILELFGHGEKYEHVQKNLIDSNNRCGIIPEKAKGERLW